MSASLPTYESTLTTPPPGYDSPPVLHGAPTPRTPSPSPAPPSLPDLPQYTAKPTTEPHTLSRTCFTWGFLCPLLWIIAVAILFIDLRYHPDLPAEGHQAASAEDQVKRERDAQIVAESIRIIRKVGCLVFTFLQCSFAYPATLRQRSDGLAIAPLHSGSRQSSSSLSLALS